MNPHKKKVLKLRASMVLAAIFGITLCMAPALIAHAAPDAQPAASAPAAKAPAPAAPAAKAPAAPAAPAAAAPAAPAAPVASTNTQSWWQAMLVPVLSAFGLFLAAFLVAGLRKLTQLVEKKWNVDIPDSVEKMMYEKARWGVGWVEEKAEKRLLHGDGVKTPGAEKLSAVVDMLMKFADGLGYGDEWQKEKVEALAEGVLHLERDVSVGSNGKRGEALAAAPAATPA
jgi:hypothetical protein